MKNKDIIEWLLDEGIDPLTIVTTSKCEIYLSDMLKKHLKDQLRAIIHNTKNNEKKRNIHGQEFGR